MATAAIIGCGDVSIIHTEALAEMDEATLVGSATPIRTDWQRQRKHTACRASLII